LVAFAAVLLGPGVARADEQQEEEQKPPELLSAYNAHPAECSRLRRQIDHFETMHARATQLRNEMWQQRLESHLELLKGMQAGRCPADVPVDTTAEAFKQLIKLAAKAAITYFTFGAAGFAF
jgi:hypothetical protein